MHGDAKTRKSQAETFELLRQVHEGLVAVAELYELAIAGLTDAAAANRQLRVIIADALAAQVRDAQKESAVSFSSIEES